MVGLGFNAAQAGAHVHSCALSEVLPMRCQVPHAIAATAHKHCFSNAIGMAKLTQISALVSILSLLYRSYICSSKDSLSICYPG